MGSDDSLTNKNRTKDKFHARNNCGALGLSKNDLSRLRSNGSCSISRPLASLTGLEMAVI